MLQGCAVSAVARRAVGGLHWRSPSSPALTRAVWDGALAAPGGGGRGRRGTGAAPGCRPAPPQVRHRASWARSASRRPAVAPGMAKDHAPGTAPPDTAFHCITQLMPCMNSSVTGMYCTMSCSSMWARCLRRPCTRLAGDAAARAAQGHCAWQGADGAGAGGGAARAAQGHCAWQGADGAAQVPQLAQMLQLQAGTVLSLSISSWAVEKPCI